MWQPSWLGALDLFVGPSVEHFAFSHALRMSPQDFLRGAQTSASVTNYALRSAISGDERPLDQLERSSSLAPALHTALENEARKLRASGAAAIEAALDGLDAERRRLDHADAALTHAHLVIGATRDFFPRGGGGRHVLGIGSHLSVCGNADAKLWTLDAQGDLLEEEGCTVRLHVTMSSASGTSEEAPKGGYLFEASVDGESLLAMARGHDEDLHFTLVDVDGRTDGDAFWEAGTEMSDLLSKA